MLTPHDMLTIRKDAWDARLPYREVLMVFPNITSGSNYDPFSDSSYDITGAQPTVTYTDYRTKARTKIIQDTTLALFNQAVVGLEVGDYLLYFSDRDKAMVDKMVNAQNQFAYLVVDGVTLRPWNDTLNGVGKTFDVYVHAKKYSPKYRRTGT